MDHYELLGLAREADPSEVSRAFRRAARQSHPDAGGRAEEFAAVAEAFRVLGDPVLRAQYDRELDGRPAGWDDVDWGAEVGGPARDGDASREPAVGPDDGRQGDDATYSPAEAGPDDRSRLDPFVGPPRRIPDPLVGGTVPDLPGVRPRAVEIAAAVAACASGVICLALVVVAWVPGEWRGEELFWPVIAGFIFGVPGVVLHALRGPGPATAHTLAAWICTAFAVMQPLSAPGGLGGPHPSDPRIVGVSVATAGTVVMAVTWALCFQRRRSHPDRVAALRRRDPGWRLDRYHRAVEWNRVREALQRPGTTAVVVGPAVGAPPGEDGYVRRWTYDPRTRSERVRVAPGLVPQGWWLVFDDEDRVVATAPAQAPEAWRSALLEVSPCPAPARVC